MRAAGGWRWCLRSRSRSSPGLPFLLQAMRRRHARPARLRLGRAAGCSPSSASAPRRARSAPSSAASPSRRSANICRPTSATEIMRDPEQLALHGEQTRDLRAVHRSRRLHQAQPRDHAGAAVEAAQPLSRPDERHRPQTWRHDRQVRRRRASSPSGARRSPAPTMPIGRVRAAVAMYRGAARPSAGAESPATTCRRSACTRVGLHRGEAVVGNFGGEGRMQYTALGDAHEHRRAARIREQGAEDDDAGQRRGEAGQRAGHLPADGPDRAVADGPRRSMVWEPVPDMEAALRARLRRRFGDASTPATERRSFSLRQSPPRIRRMRRSQIFVYRCREAGPGGHFVLGSK